MSCAVLTTSPEPVQKKGGSLNAIGRRRSTMWPWAVPAPAPHGAERLRDIPERLENVTSRSGEGYVTDGLDDCGRQVVVGVVVVPVGARIGGQGLPP